MTRGSRKRVEADELKIEETGRLSKHELIRAAARRAGVTIAVTEVVYEALLTEIAHQVRKGHQVNLSGYGKFYPQIHRGAHAQFGAGKLPDYFVLKFSAARTLSDFLALSDAELANKPVPGTTLYLGGAAPEDKSDAPGESGDE